MFKQTLKPTITKTYVVPPKDLSSGKVIPICIAPDIGADIDNLASVIGIAFLIQYRVTMIFI